MILNNLTTDELLRLHDEKISASPLMREMAHRLRNGTSEKSARPANMVKDHHYFTCPACDAAVDLKIDENHNFDVKLELKK